MFKRLIRNIFAGNTLYYPGCLYKTAVPQLNENYIKILTKLNVPFVLIDEFVCCGSPALNAGYTQDFENVKNKNIALLDKYGIGNIITPCAACYKMLKHDYNLKKKGIKVQHIVEVLNENIAKIKKIKNEKAMYHDPCHLGRHCGIYDEPRNILRAMGYQIQEFDKNRENAVCCGAGAGVKANFPEIANKIAQKKMKDMKVKVLITACPLCYLHFKENAENSKDKIEVKEIGECVRDAV